MISKCIAFLFAALLLSNCCVSGSGCGTPTGGPVAWDGLGAAPVQGPPAQDTQPTEPRANLPANKMRAKKPDSVDAAAAPQDRASPPKGSFKDRFNDNWEQQQAADRDDETRLKQKLIICRDCGASEPKRDDATTSAAR